MHTACLTALAFTAYSPLAGSAAAAPVFKTLYALPGADDGATPWAPLVRIGGHLYGTTEQGGRGFAGTVFRIDPVTGQSATIYSFTNGTDGAYPRGTLAVANGLLYGTTQTNQPHTFGTIFSIDPATGAHTTLYTFTGQGDGGNPRGGLLFYNGMLFGTANGGGAAGYGTVFRFDPATAAFTTLHSFSGGADSGNSSATLINVGAALYGTTTGVDNGAGTVFKIDPVTGAETVVYTFPGGTNPGNPAAPLLAFGGNLYGTTLSGGFGGLGTVFKINLATNTESTLCSVTGIGNGGGGDPYGGLVESGGLLYGVISDFPAYGGAIFSCDPATGANKTVYNFPPPYAHNAPGGQDPLAGLIVIDGTLYGTTAAGGTADAGTVFSFNPTQAAPVILHSFAGTGLGDWTGGTRPGFYAQPGLLNVGGTLYGTNAYAGTAGLGSVFSFNPASGTATTLYSFPGGANGFRPQASLVAIGETLYGTTFGADYASGVGTIFKTATTTGVTRTVYNFEGGPGGNPVSPLFQVGSTLYGATSGAFYASRGSVFTINRLTNAVTSLQTPPALGVNFQPNGGFVAQGGLLYGTSYFGGTAGYGVIFSVNPATGAITTVYSFTGGADSGNPSGTLLKLGNLIYGTTFSGSTHDGGVYAFNPSTGTVKGLHLFQPTEGVQPNAGLVAIGPMLYGATGFGGSSGNGTLYRINPISGAETTIYNFAGGAEGGSPQSTPININGTLYGTTTAGGAQNRGTIYSYTP